MALRRSGSTDEQTAEFPLKRRKGRERKEGKKGKEKRGGPKQCSVGYAM